VRIVQTWKKGATWWDESTRWVGGVKRLHAKLDRIGSTKEIDKLLNEDVNCHLPWDKRLCIPITYVDDNAKLSTLLAATEKATGVRLTVVNADPNYDPDLGVVHLKDAPAWVAMKLMANNCFEKTSWEPKDGGYYIAVGEETLAKMPAAPDSPWTLTIILATVSVVLGALLLLNTFLVRRKGGASKP
jgi:hypothetical protein